MSDRARRQRRLRILVPIDFSEASLRALDHAAALSTRLNGELMVLHAVEPIFYPVAGTVYGVNFDIGNVYEQVERSAREQLTRLAGTLRARRVEAKMLLCSGSAAAAIVAHAKKLKVDLIVIATHGRTGLSHLLLGSVAERVLRSAPCPVLTVSGRLKRRRGQGGAGPARRRTNDSLARAR
jgi:nucleotide-binding universal stress UspA family protein